jgi:hypothetical protein
MTCAVAALLATPWTALGQTATLGAPVPTIPADVFTQSARPVDPLFFSAEYLMWWVKNAPMPVPLVTTGDPSDPALGALGGKTTQILYGGDNQRLGMFSGLRVTAGAALSDDGTVGIEGSGFVLEQRIQHFLATSNSAGAPLLATPYFNVVSKAEESLRATIPAAGGFPPQAFGYVAVNNSSQLWGYDLNFTLGDTNYRGTRVQGLVGYRNLQLAEGVDLTQQFTGLVPGFFLLGNTVANAGDTGVSIDRFNTFNQFNGGQVGARVGWDRDLFHLTVTTKVAFGVNREVVDIDGVSLLIKPTGQTSSMPGGIFALPTNSGNHARDIFAVVPEINFAFGVDLTSRLRGIIGYNFLYISNVVRPGNQIDRNLNISQLPTSGVFGSLTGPARPAFNFQSSDYWAQGINLGLEYRY